MISAPTDQTTKIKTVKDKTMKVTICPDGITAQCNESGNVFKIMGLMISRKHNATPTFYPIEDKLCQAIFAPGTMHKAMPLSKNKIHIL